MKKYAWLIRKEFLLLIRDIPGVFILFVLPALLILVISLAQENAIRYSMEARTPVLWVDQSRSGFSGEVERSVAGSGFYDLIKTRNGKPLGEDTARWLIRRGEYQAGLVIRPHDAGIILLLDPAAVDISHPARIRSLTYLIRATEYRLAAEKMTGGAGRGKSRWSELLESSAIREMAPVEVRYAEKDQAAIRPTITQNNIPGYILFAMFLIVIPVAGNLVNEKAIGFRTRFMTLPVPVGAQMISKILLYGTVCLGQFLVMFAVGWLVYPDFSGFLAVDPVRQYPLLLLTALSAALGATGFGLLVGSAASSHGQAALFGPLMVVILAALSGAFLPVYLMPEFLRAIARFSPLYWGIENFITVFFRQGTLGMILPRALFLLLFFTGSLFVSSLLMKRAV
ncbi:MAG TPA: ABC transporter permease [Bacteroidales bacterium]|nr:ABC transporter permease [Bacteroidales bacterium]